MINTIIFDMGNVLIEWNPTRFIQEMEHDPARQEKIVQAIFTSGIWEKQDDGSLSIAKACQKSQALLDASYHQAIEQMYYYWQHYTTAYNEIQNYAVKLHQLGYQLYVLSNTSRVYYTLKQAGLLPIDQLLSGKILSFEEKIVKPDTQIYQLLLKRYQLIPEQCVFLDDIPKNIEAAQKVNIHGLLVKNEQQALHDLQALLKHQGKYGG